MIDREPATAGVDRYLAEAIAAGVTPGAVAWITEAGAILHRSAQGQAQTGTESRPMELDTPFDVASLTKPLVTAMLATILEPQLGLAPQTPARTLLPELDTLDHADITLRHLLAHASGLPAWRPLFLRAEDAAGFLRVLREEPLQARPGEEVRYSDPGYIAAGEMVARAAGAPLHELFREVIASPLRIAAQFRPGPEIAVRAAATEDGQEYERDLAGEAAQGYRGFRTRMIHGEVHDHHAWVAGGVLGSAGLFATAADLHRIGQELLAGGGDLVPGRARGRLTTLQGPSGGEARSEGFALNRDGEGSGGGALEDASFGHTGFTGTSIWIEPSRLRIHILLTNRIHPRVGDADMLEFRRGFHRRASEL